MVARNTPLSGIPLQGLSKQKMISILFEGIDHGH